MMVIVFLLILTLMNLYNWIVKQSGLPWLELRIEIPFVEMLEEADVARQDLVIALTGEDDANVLACLYAKSVSAQSKRTSGNGEDGIETIAVVHRLKIQLIAC